MRTWYLTTLETGTYTDHNSTYQFCVKPFYHLPNYQQWEGTKP